MTETTASAKSSIVSSRKPAPAPETAAARGRILLVDDDSIILDSLGEFLRLEGYETEAVGSVAAAVAAIGKQTYHLVITDVNMPNMDGITLTRSLRALPQFARIPIILLTTESSPEKKAEGKAAGATGWIVKPFQQEQLLAVVSKVLGI